MEAEIRMGEEEVRSRERAGAVRPKETALPARWYEHKNRATAYMIAAHRKV